MWFTGAVLFLVHFLFPLFRQLWRDPRRGVLHRRRERQDHLAEHLASAGNRISNVYRCVIVYLLVRCFRFFRRRLCTSGVYRRVIHFGTLLLFLSLSCFTCVFRSVTLVTSAHMFDSIANEFLRVCVCILLPQNPNITGASTNNDDGFNVAESGAKAEGASSSCACACDAWQQNCFNSM